MAKVKRNAKGQFVSTSKKSAKTRKSPKRANRKTSATKTTRRRSSPNRNVSATRRKTVKSNPRKRVYLIVVGEHYYMGEGRGTKVKNNAARYNTMIGAKKIGQKLAAQSDKPVTIVQDFV